MPKDLMPQTGFMPRCYILLLRRYDPKWGTRELLALYKLQLYSRCAQLPRMRPWRATTHGIYLPYYCMCMWGLFFKFFMKTRAKLKDCLPCKFSRCESLWWKTVVELTSVLHDAVISSHIWVYAYALRMMILIMSRKSC